ncbi:MAG: hypothetical protein CM1200mP7_1930 [Chloroflexota bacterium]|nr:MAG: hypothetical protein CM1200mP7_1930 [Chloroflexota bacterium]
MAYYWLSGRSRSCFYFRIHDFFKKFYSPSNASLAIVGDVDLKQTEELVNVYFGDLPSVNKPDLMKRFDSH